MEKLRLNNEIVSMRHNVKKAEVRVAHKLTREITKLKNRKGNEKQVQKCRRKAERLKGELDSMKKIKYDDVSKFAIKNMRTLEEILTDPQSTCLERVLGRLAWHPKVMSHVNQLRSEPVDWVALLDDLGTRTKEMKKKKKKKQKQTKDVRTFEPGQFVRIRQTSFNEDLGSDAISNENSTEEEIEQLPDKKIAVPLSVSHNKKPLKKSEKKPKDSAISDIFQNRVKNENEDNFPFCVDKSFSESSNDNSEHSSFGEFAMSSPGKNLKSLQPDPFFLTDEGEYLSSIVKDDSADGDKDDLNKLRNSSNRNHKDKNFFNNEIKPMGKSRHNLGKMSERRRPEISKGRKNMKEKQIVGKSATQNSQIRKGNMQVDDSRNEPRLSLHPSWEAKRKMQQQQLNIHAFQGKKVKFDDD